jgi:hypothetical protein
MLSQSCVAEIDFSDPNDLRECWLMWHIQGAKVRYDPSKLPKQLQYNSIMRKTPRGYWLVKTDRAKWVRALKTPLRPRGFPAHLSWELPLIRKSYSRQQSWIAIVHHAKAFLEDPGEHPLPRAKHYGGNCNKKRGACDPPPECATIIKTDRSFRQVYYNYWKCKADPYTVRASVIR